MKKGCPPCDRLWGRILLSIWRDGYHKIWTFHKFELGKRRLPFM